MNLSPSSRSIFLSWWGLLLLVLSARVSTDFSRWVYASPEFLELWWLVGLSPFGWFCQRSPVKGRIPRWRGPRGK
ncbi:MAG: hypothetical protein ACUVXA_13970 [Candidatus Jordarchaeum sp.]|uniref:hypothetical protein n=1 Tax=Candidatus Jordarchaeum sp. TaxID=2823881 RepID=UPI00404AE1AF